MDLVHRQILRTLHLVPTSLGYGSVDLHEIVPSRPLDIATPALSEVGFLWHCCCGTHAPERTLLNVSGATVGTLRFSTSSPNLLGTDAYHQRT